MSQNVEVHGYVVEQEEFLEETKAHVREWVKALRDPDAKQHKGSLRDLEGNYCVLGMACEVWRLATGGGRWDISEEHGFAVSVFVAFNSGERISSLPAEVRSYYGLEDGDGFFVHDDEGICGLDGLNDGGMSFPEIADIIEARYQL